MSDHEVPVQEVHADRKGQEDVTPKAKTEGPKKRGFAAMDRALVTELARKGGKAAHAMGKAHRFTTETAKVAGSKGGLAFHARRGQQKTA